MRIAFTTTCKNRLEHLRETWEENRKVFQFWADDVFWVLLDYGSDPDVRDWYYHSAAGSSRGAFTKHYYRFESELYHSSHAKNVASLLASPGADVVCNLDCDNYLSVAYVRHLLDLFTGQNVLSQGRRDAAGRVAIRYEDLIRIGGYDEQLHSWGFDDVELVKRAGLNGIWRHDASNYDRYIKHSDVLRGQYMLDKSTSSSFARNQAYMDRVIGEGRLKANPNGWGKAIVSDLTGTLFEVGEK